MAAMIMENDVAAETTTALEQDYVPHPTLVELCEIFTARIHGEAAAEILATGQIPETLAALPLFDFLPSVIKIGRKELGHKLIGLTADTKLSMPVRRVYTDDVVLWTAGTGLVGYRAEGMGHVYTGTVTVGRLEGFHDVVFISGQFAVERELKRLVEASRAAFWAWQMKIEPTVRSWLHQGHDKVASGMRKRQVIDEVTFEQIVDRMTLGYQDSKGQEREGSAVRLLQLCLEPDAFLRVDPLRRINAHLERDCKVEIRQAIGDTRLGPKIRAVARELNTSDDLAIVAACRERYPGDFIALDRVVQAMSVRPETIPTWVSLEELPQ